THSTLPHHFSITYRSLTLSPLYSSIFFLMLPPPPTSTLFPYTTLFRSAGTLSLPPARTAGIRTPLPSRQSREFALWERSPNSCRDRKSTRLNSSHGSISYAVFCLKKKKQKSTLLRRYRQSYEDVYTRGN